ncbi:hypothetical protein FTZ77_22625 [Salmonella enterica]|uniref:Uncharacterized protein n=1 Tax=Salmonella enterica TaxID=28901 RepID=A0A5U6SPW1_SALER|nr:hypothetical protein [Salmonella enterica]EAU2296909.1 hypothetical protein [Salmonella enterica]EBI9053745.1 hypothetical protein [Salmonella enterica]EBN7969318.1 hypothetical protein [Salmonella enterica]EBR0844820.1 hypothetical protein [Salmonella enterica]
MEFKDLPLSIQEIAAHTLRQHLSEVKAESATKENIDNMARNVRDAFAGLYSVTVTNNHDTEDTAKQITETAAHDLNTEQTEEKNDEKSPYAGNMFVYDNLIRIRGEIPMEYLARLHQALLKNLETEVFDGNTNGSFSVSGLAKDWDIEKHWNVATWVFSSRTAALEAAACISTLLRIDRQYNLDVYSYIYAEHNPLWIDW